MIVIGSERGFCGNFNESLIAQLTQAAANHVIAVGSRLCARLQNSNIAFTELSGANSSEEISQVLSGAINL
ncbi:MAG: hypothetical protein K9L22_09790 [Methylococcaceae bacterium]|nr:hypothetical protein [Methylococcaceae bacterium]